VIAIATVGLVLLAVFLLFGWSRIALNAYRNRGGR
jgi:hypothetical protein